MRARTHAAYIQWTMTTCQRRPRGFHTISSRDNLDIITPSSPRPYPTTYPIHASAARYSLRIIFSSTKLERPGRTARRPMLQQYISLTPVYATVRPWPNQSLLSNRSFPWRSVTNMIITNNRIEFICQGCCGGRCSWIASTLSFEYT